eukprot:910114-Pleurochrysis_carterae.AAC.1
MDSRSSWLRAGPPSVNGLSSSSSSPTSNLTPLPRPGNSTSSISGAASSSFYVCSVFNAASMSAYVISACAVRYCSLSPGVTSEKLFSSTSNAWPKGVWPRMVSSSLPFRMSLNNATFCRDWVRLDSSRVSVFNSSSGKRLMNSSIGLISSVRLTP